MCRQKNILSLFIQAQTIKVLFQVKNDISEIQENKTLTETFFVNTNSQTTDVIINRHYYLHRWHIRDS